CASPIHYEGFDYW
nr:immunoglobulin heavy chain junction region [Mus musculus]NSM05884.1 immunoglobulin heavy chain junction region [Mus musculus]NSM05962.1 immunoglobulin heavy chain junction region [Mus musculus]